jgi:hypothetical protein
MIRIEMVNEISSKEKYINVLINSESTPSLPYPTKPTSR